MGARDADGGWPGARGVDGASPENATALERNADVLAARDFRTLPEFRRLLVWLKANDGSGYGCIELNRAADVTAFIWQLREASGKRVAEVDYSRSGPDAELILPGQQYQTMERFREKYGNETLLVVTHLPESVDRFREEEVKSLVQEINMNRENYVYYPSQVLFAFSPWFMDRVYQAAYDFTSMLGFHADLTDWAGERQALSWEDPVAYRKLPGGRGRLELFWEDFANTGMPINRRMDAGKQYINICTYFFLHTDRELRRVGEILEMFDRVRDWNERIRNLDRETYRLLCQDSWLRETFAEWGNARREQALEDDARNSHSMDAWNALGNVFAAEGEYERALRDYGKALAIREQVLGPEHPDTATMYHKKANVYAKEGEYRTARAFYETALAIRTKALGRAHRDTALTYHFLGAAHAGLGDFAEALEAYGTALEIRREVLGPEHPDVAATLFDLANVHACRGDYRLALSEYAKALAIRRKALGEVHPATAAVERNMGVVKEWEGL